MLYFGIRPLSLKGELYRVHREGRGQLSVCKDNISLGQDQISPKLRIDMAVSVEIPSLSFIANSQLK